MKKLVCTMLAIVISTYTFADDINSNESIESLEERLAQAEKRRADLHTNLRKIILGWCYENGVSDISKNDVEAGNTDKESKKKCLSLYRKSDSVKLETKGANDDIKEVDEEIDYLTEKLSEKIAARLAESETRLAESETRLAESEAKRDAAIKEFKEFARQKLKELDGD